MIHDSKVYEVLGCIRTILGTGMISSYELYIKVDAIVPGLNVFYFNQAIDLYDDSRLIHIDPHVVNVFKLVYHMGIVITSEWVHNTFHTCISQIVDDIACATLEDAVVLLDRQLTIRKDKPNSDDYLDGFQACTNELKSIKNQEIDESKGGPWEYI